MTAPRRPLTQKQRAALWERQGGKCAWMGCGLPLKAGRFEDEIEDQETLRRNVELSMRDPRDTPEFIVSYAAHAVAIAVNDLRNLASLYPHLVREELSSIAESNDALAELVVKLTMKDAAE